MDLDGDGALSLFELEFFYEEQAQRLEARDIEPLPFRDCACQMMDMVRPRVPGERAGLFRGNHCRVRLSVPHDGRVLVATEWAEGGTSGGGWSGGLRTDLLARRVD